MEIINWDESNESKLGYVLRSYKLLLYHIYHMILKIKNPKIRKLNSFVIFALPIAKANLFMVYFYFKEEKDGNLQEELNRMTKENKRLIQLLTSMCKNHNILQNQLIDLINPSLIIENDEDHNTKKRKYFETIDSGIQWNIEQSCISYDDDCCKRVKFLSDKPKITNKVLIRTNKFDTSLVCDIFYY